MKDNAPGTQTSPLRTLLLEHCMRAGMLPLGSHLSYWSDRRKGRSSWMIHHSFFQRSGSPYGLRGDVDTFRKWSLPSSPHPREKETSWQCGRASCHGAVKHLWPAQTMPPSQTPKPLDPFRVWSTQYLWEETYWTLLPVFNLTASRAAAQCWHHGSTLVSPHSAPLHPRSRSADLVPQGWAQRSTRWTKSPRAFAGEMKEWWNQEVGREIPMFQSESSAFGALVFPMGSNVK